MAQTEGAFHLTGARKEHTDNDVIESTSAVLENMAFAMIYHAKKFKFLWDYAFD